MLSVVAFALAALQNRTSVLQDANNILKEARHVLSWIYVAKYFFPGDSPEAPYALFRSNHDDLEGHGENLNNLLELQDEDWEQYAAAGLSGLTDKLKEIEQAAERVRNFTQRFCEADELRLYFEEVLRDTSASPPSNAARQ